MHVLICVYPQALHHALATGEKRTGDKNKKKKYEQRRRYNIMKILSQFDIYNQPG